LLITATFFGFALVVYLIVDNGAGEIAQTMLTIGWGLLPISLFHIVPLFFSALSWRELLPFSSRPGLVCITWIRWIRESINSLLPVANVGGDIASARLAHLRGVSGDQAAASMVVDTTVGVVTQLVFVMTGVMLLLNRSSEHASVLLASRVLIGMAIAFVVIAAFLLLQHRSMFVVFAKVARGFLPKQWRSKVAGSASNIDDAVAATYRSYFALLRASLLRLIGWAAGAGEIWLTMQFLGQPLGMIDAFILESLGSGVRAAAFMVPGGLGALEGGFVLFGSLFGMSADTALALSLTKRVRELILGLPGLLVWHWVEGNHIMRRSQNKAR
jgi:putative membrane protein